MHEIYFLFSSQIITYKKKEGTFLFLFIQNPIKGFMRDSHSYFIQSSHSYLFSLEIIITGSLYKIYVNVFILSLCLTLFLSTYASLTSKIRMKEPSNFLLFFVPFPYYSFSFTFVSLVGTIFVSM